MYNRIRCHILVMRKSFPEQNMKLRYHKEKDSGFDMSFVMPHMAKGNLNRVKR